LNNNAGWRKQALGVIFVNLATMCWATNTVLGRWLRDDIGPLTLTTLRFTVATAFFGILLRGRPSQERRYGKDKWWIVAMGLAGVVGFSPLLYLGLRYSTAVNCSLIQGFSPLITALIAGLIIQEPVTNRQLAGAIAGLIGVAGLLSHGSLNFLLQLQFNPGDLILLAAAVLWAFYAVFGRRVMHKRSPVAATAIVHICVVPTIIGYWSWNRGVRTLGAGGAMVFYNTLPLYGAILGAALLGEPLGIIHYVFGGLIIAGGLWATMGRK
jgi:drug/metabolite transporter (DMT)-like permease